MGWFWSEIAERHGIPSVFVANGPLAVYPSGGSVIHQTRLPLPAVGARNLQLRRDPVGDDGGWLLRHGRIELARKELDRSLTQLERSGHQLVEFARAGTTIWLTVARDVQVLSDEQAIAAADEGRLVATDTDSWMGDRSISIWLATPALLGHHLPPFVYWFPMGPVALENLRFDNFESAHDLYGWSGDLFRREFPVVQPTAALAERIEAVGQMVILDNPVQTWRVQRNGALRRITDAGTHDVESQLARFAVFSRAAALDTQLAELIPPKPRGAAQCRSCKGVGWIASGKGPPGECGRCEGLGLVIRRR